MPEFQPAFPNQTRAPAIKTQAAVTVTPIARGLQNPWSLAFLPDGRMLVTEKVGALRIVTPQGVKSEPVAGTPKVDNRDQGGLLDVALSPDYARDGTIFFTYAEPREGGNGMAVARARLVADGSNPRLEGMTVIWRVAQTLDSTKHNGGKLAFAPDGTLFVTSGERSILPGRVQAQDPKSHLGKIIHITRDGQPASDNPQVAGGAPGVWSWGHRNPLSLAFDGQGRLWEVEMGPRGGDEINLIQKGRDYGWPAIGYGEEYSGKPIHQATQQAGMEQPVYYWDPVISPAGLMIYSGAMFPEWRGDLFIGGLSSKALVRVKLQGDRVVGEERLLTDKNTRIRDVRQAPDGAVFVVTDGPNGEIWKLTPAR